MRYHNHVYISLAFLFLLTACKLPSPEKKKEIVRVKHNSIILLDLSDRLIVQENQPARDKQLIRNLYSIFEERVKKDLYIKSGDQIKVVIAPQLGAGMRRDVFEDRLYVNMNNIKNVHRKLQEEQRKKDFFANLDTLYANAVFSKSPADYHGADIWKYFYEDLRIDYAKDPQTKNYLFIFTDGYPIVGHNQNKLLAVRNEFPNLHIVLLEASPREKDMEWDHIMTIWEDWFTQIGVKNYTLIKRGSITKELEQIKEIIEEKPETIAHK
jgi:hypothetical protein